MNCKTLMKNNLTIVLIAILIIACNQPKPRKPIVRRSSTFLKESIVRNKVINKLEEKAFTELMEKDTLHHYLTSDKGFWYYYETKDSLDSKLPKRGDEVIFNYTIKDINGDVIYSEDELGQQDYLVDKQELITGLQDGIKLMKEGETVTFLFPSYKAYGYSGYEKIDANQPLIYTVTLKKIIENNK